MSRRRQWGEDSTASIKLSAGAYVTLTFQGNLFDLTAEERELVSELSTVIQKYRNAVDGQQPVEPEKEAQP